MKIDSIKIENYRNIENLTLDFGEVNIIYGENAQGKTNLIEAIYLFTGARSFRGTKDADLIRFHSDFARLKIDFSDEERNQNAEILIKEKRSATLNGVKKQSASVLGEEIKAVVFSPIHLSMVKDGPAERRKFIDNALCQIRFNYKTVLKEYNRCLTQRNVLLKDMQRNPELQDMLSIWDRNFARAGAKIIYQRRRYIDELLPFAKEFFSGLSGGAEELDIQLKGSFEYGNLNIKDIEYELIKTLEKNRADDILNGVSGAGPHRDDMEILINGKSARLFGSQGQQRSCVIALKLAESSLLKNLTDIVPIALLDDVMSELDEKRQDYILNHIKEWQIFITCCDKNTVLRLKEGKTIHISNGKVLTE